MLLENMMTPSSVPVDSHGTPWEWTGSPIGVPDYSWLSVTYSKMGKTLFYSEGRMALCAYGFYEYMLDVDGVTGYYSRGQPKPT